MAPILLDLHPIDAISVVWVGCASGESVGVVVFEGVRLFNSSASRTLRMRARIENFRGVFPRGGIIERRRTSSAICRGSLDRGFGRQSRDSGAKALHRRHLGGSRHLPVELLLGRSVLLRRTDSRNRVDTFGNVLFISMLIGSHSSGSGSHGDASAMSASALHSLLLQPRLQFLLQRISNRGLRSTGTHIRSRRHRRIDEDRRPRRLLLPVHLLGDAWRREGAA